MTQRRPENLHRASGDLRQPPNPTRTNSSRGIIIVLRGNWRTKDFSTMAAWRMFLWSACLVVSVSASFLWFEKAPDPNDRCTTTYAG